MPDRSALAGPRLWHAAAADYARDIAPTLAPFAHDALRLAGVGPGARIADVACGAGDLSLAALRLGVAGAWALDHAPGMVGALRSRAAREGVAGVIAVVGDGMALPWADAAFDAALSLFGLIFFPDRKRGLRELLRVLRPGGRAVVTSWARGRSAVDAEVWRALSAEMPGLPYDGARPPLGTAEEMRSELQAAGFAAVEVHAVSHTDEVPGVDVYWEKLQRSAPPFIALREQAGADWARIAERVLRALQTASGHGPQGIPKQALVGVGTRPWPGCAG